VLLLVVSVSFAAMREGCVPVTWTLHSCGLEILTSYLADVCLGDVVTAAVDTILIRRDER
jgi:hypothetical protein